MPFDASKDKVLKKLKERIEIATLISASSESVLAIHC